MKDNISAAFCKQEITNIKELMGIMQILEEHFQSNKQNSLLPFLHTYYVITKTVATKAALNQHAFKDAKKLEELDIHFAKRYLTPLSSFLEHEKGITPWREYYKQVDNNHLPFAWMLAGINIHINADLACSLVEQKYKSKKDFDLINEILLHKIPEVMQYLSQTMHDPLGLAATFSKRVVQLEFQKIVVKWRKNAWKNAKLLAKDPSKQKELYKQTENATKLIFKTLGSKHMITHPLETIKDLHSINIAL